MKKNNNPAGSVASAAGLMMGLLPYDGRLFKLNEVLISANHFVNIDEQTLHGA